MSSHEKSELKIFATLATLFVLLMVFAWPPVEAAFNAGRVTVATTATAIFTAARRGSSVLICNRHTTSIFIGPSTVTTANGFEVAAGDCTTQRPFPRDTIFGIVAAATARVDYAEGEFKE